MTDFTHPIFAVLLFVYFVLQILDMHSTHTALVHTKNLKEGNRFVKAIMDRFGILGGLFVVKVPSLVIIGLVMKPVWLHIGILFVLCGFYIYIVNNNYKLIKRNQ